MPERAKHSKTVPQPAQVEEYDSDHSVVKRGSAVQAKIVRTTTARAAPPVASKGQKRETASDSGYSSVHSGQHIHPSTNAGATQKPSSPSKSKPDLQRTDSRRSNSSKTLSGSHSRSKPCDDPKCRDQTCLRVRSERRYTLPYPTQPIIPAAHPHYPPQLPPQYVQSPSTQVVPTLVAGPRPRTQSATQPRPTSFNGYSNAAVFSTQPGPPPSRSAYQAMYPTYYTTRQPAYPTAMGYGAQYSHPASPTSPVFPSAAPAVQHNQHNYSARQIDPASAIQSYAARSTGLHRTSSARKSSTKAPPAQYSETESESESSESEYSDSEEEHHRRKAYARLSQPRRPSLREARHTAPVVTQRSVRDSYRRSARFEEPEYLSSSENVDSDRTQRAVVAPRTESSYSNRSRRPSVATNSSGRTKTTVATSAWSDPSPRMYFEDGRGRHRIYPSKEVEANIIRRYQEQKLRESRDLEDRIDRIEAYQREVRGGATNDLTAETLRQAQSRGAPSRVSRKSSAQSSVKSKSDGIKISHGGTVLHVYGDAKIEVREGEDGEPAFIIANNNNNASSAGKDSAYQSGSKSSNSQKGRSSRGMSKSRIVRREEAVAM